MTFLGTRVPLQQSNSQPRATTSPRERRRGWSLSGRPTLWKRNPPRPPQRHQVWSLNQLCLLFYFKNNLFAWRASQWPLILEETLSWHGTLKGPQPHLIAAWTLETQGNCRVCRACHRGPRTQIQKHGMETMTVFLNKRYFWTFSPGCKEPTQ